MTTLTTSVASHDLASRTVSLRGLIRGLARSLHWLGDRLDALVGLPPTPRFVATPSRPIQTMPDATPIDQAGIRGGTAGSPLAVGRPASIPRLLGPGLPAPIAPPAAEPDATPDAGPDAPAAPAAPIDPAPPALTGMTLRIGGAVLEDLTVPAEPGTEAAAADDFADAPADPPAVAVDHFHGKHEPLARIDAIAARVEAAADACRRAARRRTDDGFAWGEESPLPVRRRLGSRKLRLAAELYENAALAVRLVPRAVARDYPGDQVWALHVAARATSQLLRFMKDGVGDSWCPVQREAFSVLDAATDFYGVYVTEGMRAEEPIDFADHGRTRKYLEAAMDGRTETDLLVDRELRDLEYDLGRLDDPRAVDDPGHVLGKIDATLSRLCELGLSPRDPRLAGAAALVDEETFDPERHPGIARVAGAGDDDASTASTERDDRTFSDILAEHGERWSGRLVFALNNRSDRDYEYERPAEVVKALDWLAGPLRDAKLGRTRADVRALGLELSKRCGWHYRPHQSATTVGRFPEWYRCVWDGRTFDVHEHVGRGDAKRMGTKSIRVAFAWDAKHEVVVVGFVGQHQRTKQS